MNRFTVLVLLLLIGVNQTSLLGQNASTKEFRKSHIAPDELVSLSKTMTFNQVFGIFYDLSKKYLGKIIVSEVSLNFQIGVDVDKKHWLDAFEDILKKNNLWYEEQADYIKIFNIKSKEKGGEKVDENAITFDSREVIISAIFFEADGSKLSQMGFSWQFFHGNSSATFSGADDRPALFEVNGVPNEWDFGSLLAVFKSLESDQVGEVVANPQITVRSGVKGRIQVGSDIAVTTRDFAGNTVTQFFSTGSIVDVTPEVIKYEDNNFIHLDLKIERSNTSTSSSGLEIKKSEAKTSILLLDGEESIIGGLYVNEETNVREGIPYLKDLPWWMFGLKYLFGYNSKNMIKKELLIIIKADLVPSLEERLVRKSEGTKERLLQKKRIENSLKMKYYKEQLKNKN